MEWCGGWLSVSGVLNDQVMCNTCCLSLASSTTLNVNGGCLPSSSSFGVSRTCISSTPHLHIEVWSTSQISRASMELSEIRRSPLLTSSRRPIAMRASLISYRHVNSLLSPRLEKHIQRSQPRAFNLTSSAWLITSMRWRWWPYTHITGTTKPGT